LIFNILISYVHGIDVQHCQTELFSAYGKLVTNAFSITDTTGRVLGTGLYLGISVHNHSCTPDAFVCFDGSTAVMRCPQLRTSYHDSWKLSVNTRCCAGGFCLVDATANGDIQPLNCFVCKRTVDLQLSEALDYNMKAKLELEDKMRSSSDYRESCSIFMDTYLSPVLSPYNTILTIICQKLICAAESVGRTDILQDVAAISLPAYRKYLPPGHPELTQRLWFAFLNMPDRYSLEEKRALLLEMFLVMLLFPLVTSRHVFVSSPFDNFRMECPKRAAAVELSIRMVESVGAKRQDVVLDMTCEGINELFPWVNIPFGISEMEREECYYSTMFDPILDETSDFSCKRREYLAGITRLTDTRIQLMCCRLRSRDEYNCQETIFNKPVGLTKSTVIE
uniref:SET domain-containing protein n=1 Tax=Angiostrongylus cantonensis TaxID=6313 RepID=A0A158PCM2_ANGCA